MSPVSPAASSLRFSVPRCTADVADVECLLMSPEGPRTSELNNFDSHVLTALRDALSRALKVSVTFADTNGKAIESITPPAGRRFVSPVCQHYHYTEGSPVKHKICDVWDQDAANALMHGDPEYKEKCGLQFACVAKPIKCRDDVVGAIFAGEVRIKDPNNENFTKSANDARKTAEDLLNVWSKYNASDYATKWAEHLKTSEITQSSFDEICDKIGHFAAILGRFIENGIYLREGNETTDMQKIVTLLGNEVAKNPSSASVFHECLGIILTSLGRVHSWLWETLDKAEQNPTKLSDAYRTAYVMFVDIRDFTFLFSSNAGNLLVARQALFTKIIDVVAKHGGITNKFLGDGVLAYFFHQKTESNADWVRRVAAAAAEVSRLGGSAGPADGVKPADGLKLGIGITFGDVIHCRTPYVGNLQSRGEITALGNPVNLAQRLCGVAHKLGTVGDPNSLSPQIIIDEGVAGALSTNNEYDVAELEPIPIKGVEGDVRVYTFDEPRSPSLREPLRKRFIYLSQGLLSSPSSKVVRAHEDYYDKVRRHGPDLAKATFGTGNVDVARMVAALMGACDEGRVGFRSNTTGALLAAINAIRKHITEKHDGSSVAASETQYLLTSLDHPTVTAICRGRGPSTVHTVVLPVSPAVGSRDWTKDQVVSAFVEKLQTIRLKPGAPLIMVIPHVTWNLGVVLPYREIADKARKIVATNDLWIIVDGAHTLGHLSIEDPEDKALRGDARIDAFACCGHKWLGGPQGTGVLWIGKRLFDCNDCRFDLAIEDGITHMAGLGRSAYSSQQVPTGQRSLAEGLCEAIKYYGVRPGDPARTVIKANERIIRSRRKWLIDEIKCGERWEARILSPLDNDLSSGIVTLGFGDRLKNPQSLVNFLADECGVFVTQVEIEVGAKDKPKVEPLRGLRVCISHRVTEGDLNFFVKGTDEFFKTQGSSPLDQ